MQAMAAHDSCSTAPGRESTATTGFPDEASPSNMASNPLLGNSRLPWGFPGAEDNPKRGRTPSSVAPAARRVHHGDHAPPYRLRQIRPSFDQAS